jgi:DnaJ-domain-containing protein 1
VSIPRRLGRLARGFVSTLQDDDRFRETLRTGRERGETLKDTVGGAFSAAWRGAAEEWRAAEERHGEERRAHEQAAGEHDPESRASASGRTSGSWRATSSSFIPRRYPLNVLSAYNRLGLEPGAPIEEIHRKRRELVKRYHPDRFTDTGKQAKAERLTAEINGAHDTIIRHRRW